MKTYFKYTNGESFTLNGIDYVGGFHVIDGIAYTDVIDSPTSTILTAKSTLLGDLHIGEYEFDNIYKSIEGITPSYINSLDLLDKQGIDNILLDIHKNNLICMKGMILSNPTVFKYSDNNCHFYGLDESDDDNPINIPYKREYSNIKPFSDSDNWNSLDNVMVGNFSVDTYENFKYICAADHATFILSGNFVNEEPLTLIKTIDHDPFYDVTYQIHNDVDNSKMIFVKNDFISVYDSTNYMSCNELLLMDQISLVKTHTDVYIWDTLDQDWEDILLTWNDEYSTVNSNNPEFIKFGKNIRTSVIDNVLYIINKYSSDVFQEINLSKYNISELLDLDVRMIDDYISLLYKSSNGDLYVCVLNSLDDSIIVNDKIKSIDESRESQHIRFSDIDSNILYVYNDKEFQTRFISNIKYPSGRLELSNFPYLKDYIWDSIDELWDYIPIYWDSNSLLSNSFNNITMNTSVANNKRYMILHNVGRIFALNQPTVESLHTSIPLDLSKYFTSVSCSESSIGLYFNNSFSNILKDVINIFNKNFGKFNIEEKKIYLSEIKDIDFITNNLYMNGNETVNVIVMQRILLLITKIQSKLLPLSS